MTTIKEQLVGTTWQIVSYQSEDVDGNTLYPLGEDLKGYIVFTASNLFAVQLMARERPMNLSEEELAKYRTDVEKKMVQIGYHAYAGHFTVNEEAQILQTEVEISLVSDYIGSTQRRSATIKGDELHLSNVDHPERKLVWKKV